MTRPERRLGIGIGIGLGLACLVLLDPGASLGDEHPTANPASAEVRETQVSVSIEHGATHRQFQATAVAKGDGMLTVLTAAHCLEDNDQGRTAILNLGDEVIEAKIVSVVRNPAYHPEPGRELPGPDNGVLRLRVEPSNRIAEDAYKALRPAPDLAGRPTPAASGQTVHVKIIDKTGHEHSVRAGNYSNHRLLEWGPTYSPVPGDSGSGVFGFRRGPDGRPRPVLIGVVVGHNGKGGAASLVSLEQLWLAEALAR